MSKRKNTPRGRRENAANAGPFASWADRGFWPELIPIIPPGVPAKLDGKFVEGDGKTPGSYLLLTDDGDIRVSAPRYYGLAGWRDLIITANHVASWVAAEMSGARMNVGLRTAKFPALDVDVKHEDDRGLVEAILKLVRGHVSTWVRYRDNSPSCAIAFRYDGEPFGKGSRAFITPGGHEAKIELLAAGQQYVVAGMHASGFPLRWRRLGARRDSLPVATELPSLVGLDAANTLLDAIYDLVIERGGKPSEKAAASSRCGRATDTTPPWRLAPDQDPFYLRLLAEGYLRGEARPYGAKGLKVDMACPWEKEHGERPESGTVYFIGGGFRCQHNSCAERRWPALLEFLRGLWGDADVDRMEVQLWNARQRSSDSRALDTINKLRARLAGAA